jgi:hypothetical protein
MGGMPQLTDLPTEPPAPGTAGSNGHGTAAAKPSLLERPAARRTIIGVLLAAAAALMVVIVLQGVTGNNGVGSTRPASVDRLIPQSGTQVLRQSQVGVDLASGYDAYLIINGVEIRNRATQDHPDGLNKVLTPDGYTITYTPGPGRRVKSLEPDLNRITAMVWRQADGPSNAVPTFWTFTAT